MPAFEVRINDIYMQNWGFTLESYDCPQPPKTETHLITIPGMDGFCDLSDALPFRVTYGKRELKMRFGALMDRGDITVKYSDVLDHIHGKKVKVIFGEDRSYFYIGRASVKNYKRTGRKVEFEINVDADPYKYETNDGCGPWLWDDLNFREGVIRNYQDMIVSGVREVVVIGRTKLVTPAVICTSEMILTCEGKELKLPAGKTVAYELPLGEGEHTLTFQGYGKITIAYRGGRL